VQCAHGGDEDKAAEVLAMRARFSDGFGDDHLDRRMYHGGGGAAMMESCRE
jgi:hypothetical protein